MSGALSASQLAQYRRDGFLVLPGFVPRSDASRFANAPSRLHASMSRRPGQATVFTADGRALHAAEQYFLTSGEAIRGFFESGAFESGGRLKADAHLALNKLGHAMHDLDPEFDAFSRTPALAAIATDIGLRTPLLLQSMYIFKQARIGGESCAIRTTLTCGPSPRAWSASGSPLTTRRRRTAACGPCRAAIDCRSKARSKLNSGAHGD